MRLTDEHNVLPQKMTSEFENAVKARNRIYGNDIVMEYGYDVECGFPDKVLTYVFYGRKWTYDHISYTFSMAFTFSTASDKLAGIVRDYAKYNDNGILYYDSYMVKPEVRESKKLAVDYLKAIHPELPDDYVNMDRSMVIIIEEYNDFIKIPIGYSR